MSTHNPGMEGEASITTLRRLMKEFQTEQKIQQPEQEGSTAASRDENILYLAPKDIEGNQLLEWQATIRGPPSGSYEGGVFDLFIRIPPSYPTKPPSMRFVTRLWHPNVSWKTGEICLDVLSSQWSPAWNLSSALTAVIALLDSPEPDSPLNVDAGKLSLDCLNNPNGGLIRMLIPQSLSATVFRTGDLMAYRSMCRMYTLLWAANNATSS